MKTTIHMCLDIRGALRWPKRMLKGMFRDDDGRELGAEEARERLMDELAKGRRVLPYGDCEGFDYQTGCPGHPSEAA